MEGDGRGTKKKKERRRKKEKRENIRMVHRYTICALRAISHPFPCYIPSSCQPFLPLHPPTR